MRERRETMDADDQSGTSRRDLIKKGVVAGLWAAPAMQVINMSGSLAGQVTSSVVTTAPTTRPPIVERLTFTGHVNRPNPCNGERVEGPETTSLVVETFETSVDVLVVVHVTLEGDELFDQSGNRYRLSIRASETFTSQMDQYLLVAPTEDWTSDGAPDFRYLGATHEVNMVNGRPVSHYLRGGNTVCLG
jgi:hypothetical protein